MRWAPVLWVLVSYAIIASSVTEAKRVQRDLTTIKKLVMSSILGSGRRKCTGKSFRRRPSNGYTFFDFPDRQNFILDTLPKEDASKDIDVTINDDGSFLNSIRQLLNGDLFQEMYKGLRGLITSTMVQSEPKSGHETNSVNEDLLPEGIKNISANTLKVSLKSLPVVNDAKIIIFNNKMNYMRQSLPSILPSVVCIVSPIVTMPRKYSYEQTKGNTVEKFTLDKNSNVIVTRNPKIPRPAFVDDRVKEVLLNMPLFLSSNAKLVHSYIGNEQRDMISTESMLESQISYTDPHRNENGNYLHKRTSNRDNLVISNTNTNNNMAAKQKLSVSESNISNNVLQQYINRLRNLERYKNTSSFIPNISDNNIQSKVPPEYFYVPPNSIQESFTKLTLKDSQNTNKENIQTRYTTTSIGQNGDIIVLKHPKDSISAYTGKPIVIGTMDNMSEVTNNFKMTNHNEIIKSQSNKYELRGDIPELS